MRSYHQPYPYSATSCWVRYSPRLEDYPILTFVSILMAQIICKVTLDYLIAVILQDPLRASDKALTSCGPYKMKEEDAMVYRRPYLTSGSSGFALNAISRSMSKELKVKSLLVETVVYSLSLFFFFCYVLFF